MKHKKYIVMGIIVAVLAVMAVFDYVRAQSTDLKVVSITPQTVVADPNVPVDITIKATKRGSLAVGDDITALVKGKGSMSGDKVRVNANGTVTFRYFPYTYMKGVFDESDVQIVFRNISDSVFIAVQKPLTVTLHVKKPDGSSGGMSMGDLFGEK